MSELKNKRERKTVIKKPHITEKATELTAKKYPVYTFEVDPKTNKVEVCRKFKEQFGVTPIKVNIVNRPMKNVRVRGRQGQKSALKKAMVFLPEGTTIDII